MFNHILLPTDGSPASERAVLATMSFAKESGAKVTALHVVPEFHVFTYRSEMIEDTPEQYAIDSAAHAKKLLEFVQKAAEEEGVQCDTMQMESDHPYEAIIETARDRLCDLIAMASHGRKGIQGVLLGSETQKVLTHSQIPVLVFR